MSLYSDYKIIEIKAKQKDGAALWAIERPDGHHVNGIPFKTRQAAQNWLDMLRRFFDA